MARRRGTRVMRSLVWRFWVDNILRKHAGLCDVMNLVSRVSPARRCRQKAWLASGVIGSLDRLIRLHHKSQKLVS